MIFVRDHLFIDRPFRDLLERARLDSVAAVLASTGDRLAAWSRTSDTIFVTLSDSATGAYVKRYHYPRWRQRIRGMFRGTFFLASRAHSEFRTLRVMRRLGIQAVRPIAYGEHRVGHFVRSCFLITEAVPDAMPLSTFIKTFSTRRDTLHAVRARREILSALARQVRQMHEAGFIHRDLFWRNVLIRCLPDDQFEFYFLDASAGKHIRLPQRRHDNIVRDIAAMGALAPEFCSKADQMRFLLEYLDTERLDTDNRRWLREVQQRADVLREAELIRLNRGTVFDPPIATTAE